MPMYCVFPDFRESAGNCGNLRETALRLREATGSRGKLWGTAGTRAGNCRDLRETAGKSAGIYGKLRGDLRGSAREAAGK